MIGCDWSAVTAIGQSNNDTKDLRRLLLITTRQPKVFRAFNRVIIGIFLKIVAKGVLPKLYSCLSICLI